MAATTLAKSERIDVRANSVVKQLLQEAARTTHKSVSEFYSMPVSLQRRKPWPCVTALNSMMTNGRPFRELWTGRYNPHHASNTC